MESTLYRGGQVSKGEVDAEFLGDIVRVRLLRHAVRMYEMNKRQGTHKVKTRAELAYRKDAMFKQKGTGRARVRHPQATQCRSGGVPHGPKVRDYTYQMPKRAKREALRSALLSKFRDGEVAIVDALAFDAPKTKDLLKILSDLGFADQRCLIVNDARCDNVILSARNLRRVEVIGVEDVNAYNLLSNRNLIITEGAMNILREKADDA